MPAGVGRSCQAQQALHDNHDNCLGRTKRRFRQPVGQAGGNTYKFVALQAKLSANQNYATLAKQSQKKHTVLLIASIVYMTVIGELDLSYMNDQVNQLQV